MLACMNMFCEDGTSRQYCQIEMNQNAQRAVTAEPAILLMRSISHDLMRLIVTAIEDVIEFHRTIAHRMSTKDITQHIEKRSDLIAL